MKAVLIVAAALGLSACVATGKKVTQEQVSRFQKGKTTYQEVIADLGEPTNSTLHSDGEPRHQLHLRPNPKRVQPASSLMSVASSAEARVSTPPCT